MSMTIPPLATEAPTPLTLGRTLTYANNAGSSGPGYSALDVTSTRLDGATCFATRSLKVDDAVLRRAGTTVYLDGEQVDTLIEQLCLARGVDSPVRRRRLVTEEGTPREVVQVTTRTVPRIERVMLPELTAPLGLWIDPSTDKVRGWWLRGKSEENAAYEVQRHKERGGWTADPCHDGTLREIDRQSPAYLRALANLRERPTEVIEERTVEVLTTRTTREALVEGVTRA